MKLKFKQQAFQPEAVKAVVDSFAGQSESRVDISQIPLAEMQKVCILSL